METIQARQSHCAWYFWASLSRHKSIDRRDSSYQARLPRYPFQKPRVRTSRKCKRPSLCNTHDWSLLHKRRQTNRLVPAHCNATVLRNNGSRNQARPTTLHCQSKCYTAQTNPWYSHQDVCLAAFKGSRLLACQRNHPQRRKALEYPYWGRPLLSQVVWLWVGKVNRLRQPICLLHLLKVLPSARTYVWSHSLFHEDRHMGSWLCHRRTSQNESSFPRQELEAIDLRSFQGSGHPDLPRSGGHEPWL